ncbi:MAG: regulatory protein RecX [Nitrospirae bacterium]|nr:regulatory protein RecX [Nitrospirota bacterium]
MKGYFRMNLDESRKARDAALRLLGLCDRSKKDLTERLIRKGFSAAIAEAVADEMESLGYIDDRRFAERFASDAVNRRDAGPQMISSGLQKKGIARDIIDDILMKVSNDYAQADIARRALGRRLRIGSVPRERAEIRRLSDYLRRRGFSYDIIRGVLKGIEQDDNIS